MAALRRFLLRCVNVLRPGRAEPDLTRELSSHLTLIEDDFRRRGFSPEHARRAARHAFGGIEHIKEQHRDARSFMCFDDARRDSLYALRMLTRNRGFTLVAVLTLALGIGANTAVFTVVDALLFRPPPFDRAERLRWIYDVNSTQGFTVKDETPVSPGNFVDWRAQSRSFDYMVAWRNWFFSVAEPNADGLVAEQVRGVSVSPQFFDMLGVHAVLGRTFRPDEEEPDHDRVVVLSDGLWKRRFAADPGVVGGIVRIDGRPFSIVGVLPPDFDFLQPDFEMWIPFTIDGTARTLRASHSMGVLARVAPNVTPAQAQADLDRITRNLQQAYPTTNAGWGAGLQPAFPLNRNLRPALFVLLAAVGCVLLIACINVANLLLVRAGARQRELAVRVAIGASRPRLIRQLLTESALLTGLGTIAGVLAAMWGLTLVRPLIPQVQVSRPLMLAFDRRVLLFTVGVACATLAGFGVWPAWRASRTESLRMSASSRRTLAGRAWSVVEIAASLMLLIGAVLLVKSLWNLQRVDPGFRPDGLLTMQVWLPETTYANRSSVSGFSQDVLRQLAQFPQVRAAAFVNTRPFQGWALGATVNVPGNSPHTLDGDPIVGCRVISPGYFAALGTPLIRGRDLADSDGADNAAVALVNQMMVRRFWPAEDPIGKSIRVRSLGEVSTAPWWPDQMTETFRIVGVVGDIKENQLKDQPEPIVYLSYLQNPSRYMHLVVRTDSAPANIAQLVQREIRGVDPDLGVYSVRTMEDALGQAVAEPKLNALFLWVFAVVALLLSAIGVYGVTSYAVAQRTREFAIRLAIGASPRSVFHLVTREGLAVAVAGIAIGLGGAVLLGRTLASLLYGVVSTDGSTLLGSAGVVLGVTLLASWRPAWRATRVDPMTILRTE